MAWKVKAPTYSNLMSWVPMFRDQEVADIPIIAASIDPCMCCMDRVHVVEDGSGATLLKEELLRLSRAKTERVLRGLADPGRTIRPESLPLPLVG